ncbi:XRE family transcriptional regulator [Erwinia sp.]|uniref:XRE family transcriptional regulator n=1 Tax=Erwinia citreus TaxID=558 RepID=UPI003C73D317
MNLDEIRTLIKNLSESEKQQLFSGLSSDIHPLNTPESVRSAQKMPQLSLLEFSLLPRLLTSELKRQNITYEEMAIQTGVSISTFKRLVAKPSAAKAINLHALLKELGIKVWLEK